MTQPQNDLDARAKAYAAMAAAYAADPCDAIYREQARRDSERAHAWLAAQGNQA